MHCTTLKTELKAIHPNKQASACAIWPGRSLPRVRVVYTSHPGVEIADNDTTRSPIFAGFAETLERIATVSAQSWALLPFVEKHDHLKEL